MSHPPGQCPLQAFHLIPGMPCDCQLDVGQYQQQTFQVEYAGAEGSKKRRKVKHKAPPMSAQDIQQLQEIQRQQMLQRQTLSFQPAPPVQSLPKGYVPPVLIQPVVKIQKAPAPAPVSQPEEPSSPMTDSGSREIEEDVKSIPDEFVDVTEESFEAPAPAPVAVAPVRPAPVAESKKKSKKKSKK